MTDIIQTRRIHDEHPPKRNGFIRRISIAPFEIAVALHSMWNGITGLFEANVAAIAIAVANNLPHSQLVIINLLGVIAGLAMAGGIMYKIRTVEIFGLWALATAVLLRASLIFYAVGWTPLFYGSNAYSLFYALAVTLRLWLLLSGKTVALIESSRAEDFGEGIISRAI